MNEFSFSPLAAEEGSRRAQPCQASQSLKQSQVSVLILILAQQLCLTWCVCDAASNPPSFNVLAVVEWRNLHSGQIEPAVCAANQIQAAASSEDLHAEYIFSFR